MTKFPVRCWYLRNEQSRLTPEYLVWVRWEFRRKNRLSGVIMVKTSYDSKVQLDMPTQITHRLVIPSLPGCQPQEIIYIYVVDCPQKPAQRQA